MYGDLCVSDANGEKLLRLLRTSLYTQHLNEPMLTMGDTLHLVISHDDELLSNVQVEDRLLSLVGVIHYVT